MGVAGWVTGFLAGDAGEPLGPENPSSPSRPDQSEDPETHDDPENHEETEGSRSPNAPEDPDAPVDLQTSTSPKAPSSGSTNGTSSSSEFKMRNPRVSRGKRREKDSPRGQDSIASSASSEFGIRQPGASIATEIPALRRQPASLSSSGEWPSTHDQPRRRGPTSFRGRQGLGIFDEEEEDGSREPYAQNNPRSPEGSRPPPYSLYEYWSPAPRPHDRSPPRDRSPRDPGSGNSHTFFDDPDELYNASPPHGRASPRGFRVPNPDWVRDEGHMQRPLDDPAFYPSVEESVSDTPLSESSIRHVPRRLRVRNTLSLDPDAPPGLEPEYLEHVDVNPLEGFQNTGEPSPEAGTGLQGFMVDTQQPGPEIKDYHAHMIGPVSRDHFNEFKAHTNASISELRRVAFHAAQMQWAARRDLQRQILLTQEAERRAQAATEQAMPPAEVQSRRGDPYAPPSLFSEERKRAPLSPQYRARKTSSGSLESDEGNDPNVFLYENGADQTREQIVRVALLRAQVAWHNSRRPDWNRMENMARTATLMAETLDYPPLVARCFFYRGVAEYGQKRYINAEGSFEEAQGCWGKYKEGMFVDAWSAKVGRRLRRQGEGRDGTERSESPLSPTGRRESYAEPEHPPEFDVDDFASGGEEEGADPTEEERGAAGPEGGGRVHEMGIDTVVPPERRQSVQEEVQRRLSRDDGSKSSKGTDEEGFKNVSL